MLSTLTDNFQYFLAFILAFSLILNSGCTDYSSSSQSDDTSSSEGVIHPEWTKDAVIYEVNVRQYSKESSFNAITKDLPRVCSRIRC